MERVIKQDKCFIYGICFLFFCLFVLQVKAISAAEMPDYQRLTPITSNINSPTSIAIDINEKVYVTESTYNRMRVYSHQNEYEATLTGLDRPISVAIDNTGRIYIGNHYDNLSDQGNVEVYDAGLNFLFKLGSGDGEFRQPNSICIDNITGYIYVVDKVDNLVKVYSSDGTFNSLFDGTLGGGGQFAKPLSIVIDEIGGDLVILDRPKVGSLDGARIQFYQMNGTYEGGFDNRYGMDVGQMFKPKHLTVDTESRIYVTDTQHDVVLVYERDSTFLGTVYDLDNPMRTPLGITISDSNRLFIASLTLGRVDDYGMEGYTQMSVNTSSMSFEGQEGGTNPAYQTVEISNSGTGTLNWTAEKDESWITLSAASGSTGAASATNLNIGIDLNGLTVGSYSGSVDITAESGAIETVSVDLDVTANPFNAVSGGPYSGQEGETITFDASASTGAIVLYEWDLDNDGTYEYSSASPTQGHAFTQTGIHWLNLRITNNLGAFDYALTTVTISDSVPVAGFSASVTSGEVSLAVNFTNSSTGFDQSLTYAWDFDNDGTTDSTDVNPSFLYEAAGTYSVKLTVTDSDTSVNTLIKTDYITADEASGGCQNSFVMIDSNGYSTILQAYAVANNGDIIKVRAENHSEVVTFDRDISVTLEGGYNCDYSGNDGLTTINGDLIITNGSVIAGNIVLE